MTRLAVSAPGKAFLIGEYAVLAGATALVTAVGRRAVASHCDDPDRPPASPLTEAAYAHVRAYLSERTGTFAPGPLTSVDTGSFAAGARKLGLGSSAAAVAAVVGFHLAEAGLDPEDPEVRAVALRLAQTAHAQVQGGGSGADVACAVLGGTIAFTRGEAPVPVAHPAWLHVGFFDAGAPAITASFVQQVRAAGERDPAGHAAATDLLRRAADLFRSGYTSADPDAGLTAIRDAVALHNEGLRALQRLSDAPIVTPTIAAIVDQAARMGLAAKPSGAGGGDLVVVFAARQADLDLLGERLQREHGLAAIGRLPVAAPGLRRDERPPLSSRMSGFFRLGVHGRRDAVATATAIPRDRFAALDPGSLDLGSADNLIENVIGTLELPLAVATNFRINGRDFLVPMAVEEASVVAAASNAAKMIRAGGGFYARSDPPWMVAQVQLTAPRSPGSESRPADLAVAAITAARADLLALADSAHPRLIARGGGSRDLLVRVLAPDMLVVDVVVDCQDAMGANLLNTIAEVLAPRLSDMTGWTAGLRILSNLADRRCAHVTCRVPPNVLAGGGFSGAAAAAGIASASRFAELDPYRAATHNKGVMNGVDAVVLATGNDWRAMEAGAHAYAGLTGTYRPLATWRLDAEGWLCGAISLPAAVGVVGGATKVHPAARLALEILGATSGAELGQVMAAVGLASNLAALRALATEGIQRGHMSLHARAVALGAGAHGPEVDLLVHRLVQSAEIKHDRAVILLHELRSESR
ncbi:hydroxymethylglutaryl-CoA reductase, degradative [Nannocystis radixulma]|uniref:3-hydroxy-3-methylglutaryl coenzyme A reductase n=1 Tax=Nannocystis radixulma TaxID=2995305 RepID=A0ABT5BCL3_9BACT|nr:hydroxymethylglutaryl-CoA reductase, degradative [Nannocystis radixulma]MDC0671884.1 hydroxymethylglutaryl-CoA reductase, degradative [Nannocystis radixulma]